MTAMTSTVDYTAIKARQRDTWAAGDYAVIGTTLQIVGEALSEAVDIQAGERVLDVAAGNGNASLAAARRGAQVTATDYVTSLLDLTQTRAASDGLTIVTQQADAEALPFPDGSFDAVLSTFGVMFTPNQDQAVAELIRAVRPGGRIGLANWTPAGFIGQLFKTIGRYVSPPAGIRSPLAWGDEARLHELFGSDVQYLDVNQRQFIFRYRSAQHLVDTFRTYYGPMLKAFAAVDEADRPALERDLLALADAHNTSSTGTLRVPSDYLEVVAVKRD